MEFLVGSGTWPALPSMVERLPVLQRQRGPTAAAGSMLAADRNLRNKDSEPHLFYCKYRLPPTLESHAGHVLHASSLKSYILRRLGLFIGLWRLSKYEDARQFEFEFHLYSHVDDVSPLHKTSAKGPQLVGRGGTRAASTD
jgi:hypothetical protein